MVDSVSLSKETSSLQKIILLQTVESLICKTRLAIQALIFYLIETQSDYFSCLDLIPGCCCRILVKFLRSIHWSLFYGSLNVYTFFYSPSSLSSFAH